MEDLDSSRMWHGDTEQEPRWDPLQSERSSSQEEGPGALRGEVPGGLSGKKPLLSFDEFQKTRGVEPGTGQVTFRIPRQGQALHPEQAWVRARVVLEGAEMCSAPRTHYD